MPLLMQHLESIVPGRRSLRINTAGIDAMASQVRSHGDVWREGRKITFGHPDAIRDIFTAHDRALDAGPYSTVVRRYMGNGLLCSSDELHRRQKAVIQPVLHPKRITRYTDLALRHATEFERRIEDGRPLDTFDEMMSLSLRVIAEVLFGFAVGAEATSLGRTAELVVNAISRSMYAASPALGFLVDLCDMRAAAARWQVRRTLRRFVEHRRRANANSDPAAPGMKHDDLLDRLLSARGPDGAGRPMPRRLVLAECINLFMAGYETTAAALTFALTLLAFHPDEQSRVREELDDEIGDRGELSPAIIDRLSYTRMVVAETLRLLPPAYAQTRRVRRPFLIAGHRVAAGDELRVYQWITHRDPRWWPDSLKFDPRRFTPDRAAARPRWAYFPFGGGQRACVGESFAWPQMILTLATILRRWRVEPAEDIELSFDFGITIRPKVPVRLLFRR